MDNNAIHLTIYKCKSSFIRPLDWEQRKAYRERFETEVYKQWGWDDYAIDYGRLIQFHWQFTWWCVCMSLSIFCLLVSLWNIEGIRVWRTFTKIGKWTTHSCLPSEANPSSVLGIWDLCVLVVLDLIQLTRQPCEQVNFSAELVHRKWLQED